MLGLLQLVLGLVFANGVFASPLVDQRVCVTTVVTVSMKVTATVTSTTNYGNATTSVIFVSGQRPTPINTTTPYPTGTYRRAEYNEEKRDLTSFADPDVDTRTRSCKSVSATETSTTTVTKTATAYSATVTSFAYPCATPLATKIPTLPYGLHQTGASFSTGGNSLYGLGDPVGASAESCCNACFFELQNCIQAYWYSYEGCVVMQPGFFNSTSGEVETNAPGSYTGTGQGVSDTCPGGKVKGLVYGMDHNPDPRGVGDFAGPCGTEYDDL